MAHVRKVRNRRKAGWHHTGRGKRNRKRQKLKPTHEKASRIIADSSFMHGHDCACEGCRTIRLIEDKFDETKTQKALESTWPTDGRRPLADAQAGVGMEETPKPPIPDATCEPIEEQAQKATASADHPDRERLECEVEEIVTFIPNMEGEFGPYAKNNSGYSFERHGVTPRVFGLDWDGPAELKSPRGFHWNPVFEERCKLILSGLPTAQVLRQTGCKSINGGNARRVNLLRKILSHLNGDIFCPCGRRPGHFGHCKPRYFNSPDIQSAWFQTTRLGLKAIAKLREAA